MRYKILYRYFKFILGIAFCVALTACGSIKPPLEKLAVADQMIKQADANEAHHYAPLEFRLASEKMEEAKRAMENNDYLIAERLADQATIDARTALAKADSVRAQHTVNELKQSIDLLRLELKSKVNP